MILDRDTHERIISLLELAYKIAASKRVPETGSLFPVSSTCSQVIR